MLHKVIYYLILLIDEILNYFKRYGEISGIKLINDKSTGLCKGYGFVTCGNEVTFRRIMDQEEHKINGRIIDCNIACKKESAPEKIKNLKKKKIFVGGLTPQTNNCILSITLIFF